MNALHRFFARRRVVWASVATALLILTDVASAQPQLPDAPPADPPGGSRAPGEGVPTPPPAMLDAVPGNGMVAPNGLTGPGGGMGPRPAPQGGLVGPGRQVPLPAGPLPARPLLRRDVSWIYINTPRPRKVGVHDIITVVVDEKSEVTQNSRFNRQRNATFVAQLQEWLRINSNGDLDVAAGNTPGIQGTLRSQMQSFGTGLSQEGMKYRIAATVVDILPNGTLILEAHKSIRSNTELWEYTLTGRIRSQDVASNNTVSSENIADLKISKIEHGKIQDSTKRGYLTRLYDYFLPF
jgi:flagellar L-ring protein precursor FlgH